MLTHTLIVFRTLTVEEYFVKCLLSSYSARVCRSSPQFGVTLATYEYSFYVLKEMYYEPCMVWQ